MADVVVRILTKINRASLDSVDADIQRQMQQAGQNAATAFSRELTSANPKIRKAAGGIVQANADISRSNRDLAASQRRVADATRLVADGERKLAGAHSSMSGWVDDSKRLSAARRSLADANREVVRGSGDFERAMQRQQAALGRLREAKADDAHRHRRGGGGGGRGGGGLGNVFSSIPFVPNGKAGLAIGGGLVSVLGSAAEAATTASQAIWLLPAAASAAGAGFLTLKIGMSGFDKALKATDPKKFAEALQGLAPNAQQAALEIRQLTGGLNGLKAVTQNAMFKGVAQQLAGLGKTFMPEVKQLTTGVAGAMNQAFQNVSGQLRTPGTASAIGALVNNITAAFRNLAPAMGPVTDAFARIARVGSDFLPGMATGIANLATKFADFITKAQESGKLQEWIQKGIDAASTLGHVIGDIGHKIFDVFGNKTPAQFKSTLDGMVGAAVSVAQAIAGISQVANGVIGALRPIAAMVGGWPALIRDVVIAWGAWKVTSTISQLGTVANMLASGLPAAARTGAAGILSALNPVLLALGSLNAFMPGWHGAASNVINQVQGKQSFSPKDWANALVPGTNIIDQIFGHHSKKVAPPGQPDGKPATTGPGWAASPNMPGSSINDSTPWNPLTVPTVPGKKGKGGLPKVSTPYGADFSAPPRPGESEGEYAAEGALLQAKHRKADDEAALLAMKKANNASAEQIQAQENKIAKDQRDINKAELELQQARDTANKKALKGLGSMTDSLDGIGPKLDEDFGLSQGLPGLAKNLVEFVAELGAAPLLGKLAAIRDSDPNYHGGYGAIGSLAESNMAAGKSPLLGIPAGRPGGPSLSAAGMSLGGAGNAAANSVASGGPGAVPTGMSSGGMGGLNLSTIPVAAQKYANDCIDASARIILSHSGVNMTEDQLKGVITPGGSIQSQAAGMNQLDPAGQFKAMPGSGGNPAAMFNAIRASIENGVGSVLNVAPGSALGGHTFAPGHFIAATGVNPDGSINVSDTAGGKQYSVSQADAFQATRGRGIVAGTGSGPGAQASQPIQAHLSDYSRPASPQPPSPVPFGGPSISAIAPTDIPGGGGNFNIAPWDTPDRSAPPLGGIPGAAPSPKAPSPPGPGKAPSPQPSFPGPGKGTRGFPNPGGASGGPFGPGATAPVGPPKGGGFQPAGGGLGVGGGVVGSAITSAAGMFPGGGAAAQLAMKLASRTIKFGGELAGIGTEGLMETFGVHGDSKLSDPMNNIFGRLIKGIAQAKPAAPTSAGKAKAPKDDKDGKGGKPGQGGDGKQVATGLHIHGDFIQAPGQDPQSTYSQLAYLGALGASTPMSVV